MFWGRCWPATGVSTRSATTPMSWRAGLAATKAGVPLTDADQLRAASPRRSVREPGQRGASEANQAATDRGLHLPARARRRFAAGGPNVRAGSWPSCSRHASTASRSATSRSGRAAHPDGHGFGHDRARRRRDALPRRPRPRPAHGPARRPGAIGVGVSRRRCGWTTRPTCSDAASGRTSRSAGARAPSASCSCGSGQPRRGGPRRPLRPAPAAPPLADLRPRAAPVHRRAHRNAHGHRHARGAAPARSPTTRSTSTACTGAAASS